MLLSFLLALLALVAACPPPLNDFKYLGNDTHTTADMIRALVAQTPGGMGWSEIVTQSGIARTAWPDGNVQYCFTNQAARTNFGDDIKAAWKLWHDRIGDASAANGHNLRFREYTAQDGSHPFCHLSNSENWNPKVPHDVAAFDEDHTAGVQAWSITGYMPSDFNDDPDRHGSRFNVESKNKYPYDYWITTVAHELGHVFGFWHEQQRWDRNYYVHFDCTKLKGYAGAKAKVDKEGKYKMDEICNNYFLATLYGFGIIRDFDTIDHTEWNDGVDYPLIITSDLEFDDESIMLYSSAEFIEDGHDSTDVMQVPLAFWKNRHVGFDPPEHFTKADLELIPVNWEVSDGDYEGVKHVYPWE
ncbi:hypothetical protein FB567DRAFT_603521 [Paraphoma chrysanthemicola]|uniref:Peptidase metallopeptidase domain-containing protein n=1 Tax=Paraphoma chrysanthemicola TaxID=798071 RepID=A0A8K0R5X3_9PLEO|nr:hypothetical protein FB567DRAFT_603521 [Paraphoma chrysanthemicola]